MPAYDKLGRRAVADAYDSLPLSVRLFIRLRLAILPLEAVEAFVPTGAIADIGCGYGLLAHYLAYKDPHRAIMGIEREAFLVRRAKKTVRPFESIRFREGNAEALPSGRYDGVVMCDLLHHLSARGQEHLLRVAKESLNPHGRLVIKDIEKERSFYYYWNLFHDRVLRLSGPTHHRSADEWAAMMRGLGLTVVEQRHFRHLLYHHILIVAELP